MISSKARRKITNPPSTLSECINIKKVTWKLSFFFLPLTRVRFWQYDSRWTTFFMFFLFVSFCNQAAIGLPRTLGSFCGLSEEINSIRTKRKMSRKTSPRGKKFFLWMKWKSWRGFFFQELCVKSWGKMKHEQKQLWLDFQGCFERKGRRSVYLRQ